MYSPQQISQGRKVVQAALNIGGPVVQAVAQRAAEQTEQTPDAAALLPTSSNDANQLEVSSRKRVLQEQQLGCSSLVVEEPLDYFQVFKHIAIYLGSPLTFCLGKRTFETTHKPYIMLWALGLHSMWIAWLFAEDRSELPITELIIPWLMFFALLVNEAVENGLKKKRPPEQVSRKFEPGSIGISYDEDGLVEEVFVDGQARTKVIQEGYRIVTVTDAQNLKVALTDAEASGKKYDVTFEVASAGLRLMQRRKQLKKEALALVTDDFATEGKFTSTSVNAIKNQLKSGVLSPEEKGRIGADRAFFGKCCTRGNKLAVLINPSIHGRIRGVGVQVCACGFLVSGLLAFVFKHICGWTDVDYLSWAFRGLALCVSGVFLYFACIWHSFSNWVGKYSFDKTLKDSDDEILTEQEETSEDYSEEVSLRTTSRPRPGRACLCDFEEETWVEQFNQQFGNGIDKSRLTYVAFSIMTHIIDRSKTKAKSRMLAIIQGIFRATKWYDAMPKEDKFVARLDQMLDYPISLQNKKFLLQAGGVVGDGDASSEKKTYKINDSGLPWAIFPDYLAEIETDSEIPCEVFINQFLLLHHLPRTGWCESLFNTFLAIIVHFTMSVTLIFLMWSPAFVRGGYVKLQLPKGFFGCWVDAMWVGLGSLCYGQWLLNLYWFQNTIRRLLVGFHAMNCIITGDDFRDLPLPKLNLATENCLIFWGELRAIMVDALLSSKMIYEKFLAFSLALVTIIWAILLYEIIKNDWTPELLSCAFTAIFVGFVASVVPNLVLGVLTNMEGQRHLATVSHGIWGDVVYETLCNSGNSENRKNEKRVIQKIEKRAGVTPEYEQLRTIRIESALLQRLRQDTRSTFTLLGITLTTASLFGYVSAIASFGGYVLAKTTADDKILLSFLNVAQTVIDRAT